MTRVLVVEDDSAVRDVVEHALRREGMETKTLEDGEAALEHLRKVESYDLVILDVMLPGSTGSSFAASCERAELAPVSPTFPSSC